MILKIVYNTAGKAVSVRADDEDTVNVCRCLSIPCAPLDREEYSKSDLITDEIKITDTQLVHMFGRRRTLIDAGVIV